MSDYESKVKLLSKDELKSLREDIINSSVSMRDEVLKRAKMKKINDMNPNGNKP